ncbi:MAG: glycosyltransferase family 4 protein, partial [Mycobacteriaceae bacterium]
AQASGENIAVDREVDALRRSGVNVTLAQQATDDRERHLHYKIEAAATTATGIGRSPLRLIRSMSPDVIHVHNLFPNYGRGWVRKIHQPIVATLHNFRPLCPAGTFYRNGHVCTDCLDQGSSMPSIWHGCYRDSHVQTIPLAMSTRFSEDPLLRRADRLIVLTETMRDLYMRGGVDPEKLIVLPNFLASAPPPGQGGGPWLFVGRLSPEKGVLELVTNWPRDRALLIVGEGPLRDAVAAVAPNSVRLLGRRSPEDVKALMGCATGLVFPSRWFEGFPMVYVEALASGTPVLAWRPSSVAELVLREGTGMIAGSDLPADLARAEMLFPSLRDACRSTFEQRYGEDEHLDALKAIYADVSR